MKEVQFLEAVYIHTKPERKDSFESVVESKWDIDRVPGGIRVRAKGAPATPSTFIPDGNIRYGIGLFDDPPAAAKAAK